MAKEEQKRLDAANKYVRKDYRSACWPVSRVWRPMFSSYSQTFSGDQLYMTGC